jgi:phospho-N-acetylmuramoyl-pentapeptide-transferase
MIGFFISILIGSILVPYLKRKKIDQSLSIYLSDTHKSKVGTPTMGGLIFILSTIIGFSILVYFEKLEVTYNVIIVIFTFISYALIGFIDDFLIIKRKNNNGLTENEKLILQIIVATIFFYLFMLADNEPLLWIHLLNIKWDIGFFYGVFILFVLLASSNAVNLTDGLDGLATGLAIISIFTFGILTLCTGWLEGYMEISIFLFLLTGSLLGFLIFNSYPAKIFMGDTGSLALGATLGTVAILTRHELLLVVIGIVFVLETTSCILQRYYYKLTKKRLFKMAPIHHTFEKMGWKEPDIVKLFWIIGLIGGMIGIIYGVWL